MIIPKVINHRAAGVINSLTSMIWRKITDVPHHPHTNLNLPYDLKKSMPNVYLYNLGLKVSLQSSSMGLVCKQIQTL